MKSRLLKILESCGITRFRNRDVDSMRGFSVIRLNED